MDEYSTEKVLKVQAYVADTVRAYRKKNKLSFPQLGARVGMTADRISRIHAGTCELHVRDLLKLSPTLDVSASQLLRLAGL